MEKFDIVVIGSGPGGYVCAIRCAQLGFKVACIEKNSTLGGTCLNVGCIPSKALLESSNFYNKIKKESALHGINVNGVEYDIDAMMSRKKKIVESLTQGIKYLFKKNKITHISGQASFISENKLRIEKNDLHSEIWSKNFVIATGSKPIELKGMEFDGDKIINSTDALSLKKAPDHLAVIGGGVIGLEIGSIWSNLNSKVTVIEAADSVLSSMDKDIGVYLQKILKSQGFDFYLNSKLENINKTQDQVKLNIRTKQENININADKVLIAVGRKASTDKLGLDTLGVDLDLKGNIKINNKFQSSIPNIYAIGDVVAGLMLAHKAEDEGIAVAEIIKDGIGHVNYDVIPSVVYTHPEIASVGLSEQECKQKKIEFKSAKFPFSSNGRSKCYSNQYGWVKILTDKRTDKILGLHILGEQASELIAQAVIAMEYKASAEDIARSIYAHPSLSEAIKEAALLANDRGIHI